MIYHLKDLRDSFTDALCSELLWTSISIKVYIIIEVFGVSSSSHLHLIAKSDKFLEHTCD